MIEMDIRAEGMERANELIAATMAAAQMTMRMGSIDLHAKRRDDGADPVTIANELIKRGRDFFSLTASSAGEVATAFALEIEKRQRVIASKPAKPLPEIKMVGNAVHMGRGMEMAKAAGRAAMSRYMELVGDNIDRQRTWDGGTPDALSDEYADYKREKFGFTDPIGVATGQLRENFDPSNRGNIRSKMGGKL